MPFCVICPKHGRSGTKGENTWSALDVVGHLIHGERTDWMPRAKMVLQFGETKAFEPFDRLGHVRESQSKSLVQLLDEFARLRSETWTNCVHLACGKRTSIGVDGIRPSE